MTASKNLLLMAVLILLSAVAANFVVTVAVATATAGGGEVRGEGRVDPTAAGGGYAVCRVGCPDAFFNCNDWCLKSGYKNGGDCVPPLRQQCCCVSPKSA